MSTNKGQRVEDGQCAQEVAVGALSQRLPFHHEKTQHVSDKSQCNNDGSDVERDPETPLGRRGQHWTETCKIKDLLYN